MKHEWYAENVADGSAVSMNLQVGVEELSVCLHAQARVMLQVSMFVAIGIGM